MRRALSLAVGLGLLTATASAVADDRYIFFGDSLVDNQNSFQFTTRILGSATPESPPYFEGRFSNGANWTDRVDGTQLFYYEYYLSDTECTTENSTVAASGACDTSLDPGAQSGVSMNFSFGGSRSGTETLLNAPGFLTALEDLEGYNSSGRVADVSGSVFAVWTGGNDYSNYALSGTVSQAEIVDEVLDNIENGLVRMNTLGAKRVLVFNIQPLETIPTFIDDLGTAGATTAGEVADLHNEDLPGRLRSVSAQTGMDIVLVDVDSLYTDINSNPSRYGFTNITSGCIDETTLDRNSDCSSTEDESGFLYWDGTHPTTVAHGYIHELFEATIQAVDVDPGRLAAIPDSSLIHAQLISRGIRTQLDHWRAETAVAALAPDDVNPTSAKVNDFSLFVVGTNTVGQRASDGDFSGYDYDSQGAVVGFDYRPSGVTYPTILGGHLGVVTVDSDINGGGSFDNRAYALGGFAGVRNGPGSITAQVTGLYLDIDDVERETSFSVLSTARSDTEGWAIGGEVEGRWDFSTKAFDTPVWIAPLARLSAASAKIDGFTESDASFLNLTIDDSSLSEIKAGIGVSVWSDLQSQNGRFSPFATVVWEHDLLDADRDIDGSLSSGQTVSSDSSAGIQDALSIDAGLRADLDNGISLEALVSATFATGANESFVVPQLRFRKVF